MRFTLPKAHPKYLRWLEMLKESVHFATKHKFGLGFGGLWQHRWRRLG